MQFSWHRSSLEVYRKIGPHETRGLWTRGKMWHTRKASPSVTGHVIFISDENGNNYSFPVERGNVSLNVLSTAVCRLVHRHPGLALDQTLFHELSEVCCHIESEFLDAPMQVSWLFLTGVCISRIMENTNCINLVLKYLYELQLI